MQWFIISRRTLSVRVRKGVSHQLFKRDNWPLSPRILRRAGFARTFGMEENSNGTAVSVSVVVDDEHSVPATFLDDTNNVSQSAGNLDPEKRRRSEERDDEDDKNGDRHRRKKKKVFTAQCF